jgi:hypothetical protein
MEWRALLFRVNFFFLEHLSKGVPLYIRRSRKEAEKSTNYSNATRKRQRNKRKKLKDNGKKKKRRKKLYMG